MHVPASLLAAKLFDLHVSFVISHPSIAHLLEHLCDLTTRQARPEVSKLVIDQLAFHNVLGRQTSDSSCVNVIVLEHLFCVELNLHLFLHHSLDLSIHVVNLCDRVHFPFIRAKPFFSLIKQVLRLLRKIFVGHSLPFAHLFFCDECVALKYVSSLLKFLLFLQLLESCSCFVVDAIYHSCS